jgi:hypothetical protein
MSRAFAGEAKTDARDAEVITDTARMRDDLTDLAHWPGAPVSASFSAVSVHSW